MDLKSHAISELRHIGYDPDKMDDNDMNKRMFDNIIELIEVFSQQRHSGASAHYCINTFSKLAKYGILSPLTGEDDEWVDVGERRGPNGPKWQNKRYSPVFKNEDGTAYDVDAVVFMDEDGITFTNKDSVKPVEFPYMPNKLIKRVRKNK